MLWRVMLRSALVLVIFAVVGVTLVALSFNATRERIAANERAALLRSLHQVVGPEEHDNDIFRDVIEVRAPIQLGSEAPVPVYRARKDGKPVAAVLTPVAPDGYNGSIRLVVGIYYDGRLSGVRVIAHRETPGLGDAIEAERSDWILGFAGRSLLDPDGEHWKVKRDGGIFDQFTGATITPRAVVGAVYRCLKYYSRERDRLFQQGAPKKAAGREPVAPGTGGAASNNKVARS